jgi:hypothetical protein
MQRFWCFICLLLGVFCVKAQENTNFLADEVAEANRNPFNLCQPGVLNKSRSKGLEIGYKFIHKGEFEQKTYANTFHRQTEYERESKIKSVELFNFKLKMPILLKPGLKIIAGYSYSPEIYRFKNIDSEYESTLQRINNRTLKNNSFSLTVTKPWNNKFYTAFRIKTAYRGDYGGWMNFDSRFRSDNFLALMGYKKNNFTEIAGGIAYSRGIYSSSIVPFLVVNKTFNKNWGLEAVLPGKIMGRYNFNPKSLILFGAEYNSGSFSLDAKNNQFDNLTDLHMQHSEIRLMISLEKQIVPWIWSNVRFGYQKNFNTQFKDSLTGTSSFELSRNNPVYFQIGIFLSPPGGCM